MRGRDLHVDGYQENDFWSGPAAPFSSAANFHVGFLVKGRIWQRK
jgi:hypothetical protein